MKLFKLANKFARAEDGAVTVDWVVLTAAVVGLGVAVLASVQGGTQTLGDNIATALEEVTVSATPGAGATATTTPTE